jgi:hypothetical protein
MSLKDERRALEEKTTPIECVNEIIECLESLYTRDGGQRIAAELIPYAGHISIALRQAKLLKTKLYTRESE